MLYQVDDALLHAMSGIELSRVRTELRLLLPEAYQQKSDRVERGRHCYAIKCPTGRVTLPNWPLQNPAAASRLWRACGTLGGLRQGVERVGRDTLCFSGHADS